MRFRLPGLVLMIVLLGAPGLARAQGAPGGPPPAVGVVRVEMKDITESSEFIGRIQAVDRVDLTARVTAFVQERLFVEGTEVKAGDLLYRLERAPFEAAVQQQAASVAQTNALFNNASITLGRAQALLNTPAGQRSTVDDARANQLSQAAQLMSAQAQLRQAQINLDYTEIRAPIGGKISQTRFSVGNVVSPSSGPLNTIVSQDPMYVAFPVSVRALIDVENRYATKGGVNAIVVRLRLPDGSTYGQGGKIDFIDPTVAANTDTILVRAVIANPTWGPDRPGMVANRTLTDGEFVTVLVEGVQPIAALTIPRSAVLSDQQGNYVYVVNGQNVAEQRRIQLGQSTPETAVISSGLTEGELVVVDGIQRVRPGSPVTPGPATPGPGISASASGPAPAPAATTAGPPGSTAAAGPAPPAAGAPTGSAPTGSAPTGGAPAAGH